MRSRKRGTEGSANRSFQKLRKRRRAGVANFADDAEADIVRGVVRGIRAAHRGAQTREARFPTAAAINARAAGWNARILFQRARQRLIEIEAPFPDVARHVFEPKEAGPERERPHR